MPITKRAAVAASLALCMSGAAGLALSTAVSAQQVCVECSEPPASYSCTIEQSDKIVAFRNSDRVIRYGCVQGLAKLGNHASCRAGQAVGPCPGQPVQLSRSQLLMIEPPVEAGPSPEAAQDSGTARSGPPRTMKELAQNTLRDSKEGLESAGETVKKAGQAVGGAMQKTWNCLTSLFNKC
ncbi:MAG: hypothetical protein RLZ98_2602 [Pseudomonadota bacterium]